MSRPRTDDPGLSWRRPGKDYGDLTDAEQEAEAADHDVNEDELEPREAEG